jgi:hypothetical protein
MFAVSHEERQSDLHSGDPTYECRDHRGEQAQLPDVIEVRKDEYDR